MASMATPDVVVIGAGPAGGTAAWLLASRGAGVLLVDRSEPPRPKLCGGCLASSGIRVLDRIGLEPAIPSLSTSLRLDALELRSGSASTRIAVPPYSTIDRAAFDFEIARAAVDHGAQLVAAARARLLPGGEVAIETSSETWTCRPSVVVVADGLSGSSLDADERFAWRTSEGARVGVGAMLAGIPASVSSDAITMMHAPGSYLGVAPLAGGGAVVAAAVAPAWIRRHAEGGVLYSLLVRHGLHADVLAGASRTLGSAALSRRRPCVEADGRIFLIGDATGYIEPFTGEGMSWAIEHAELVVPFVLDAIAGRAVPGAWTACLRRWRRRRTVLCAVTTRAVRSTSLTRAAIRLCSYSHAASGMLSSLIGRAQAAPSPETA